MYSIWVLIASPDFGLQRFRSRFQDRGSFADEAMANFGEQTPEEAKLEFVNLSGLSTSDALDEIFRIAGINGTQGPPCEIG